MKKILGTLGGILLGAIILIIPLFLFTFFFMGGVWLSEKLLPILEVASNWAFLFCLFILIPLTVFHPTRGFAGIGLFIASYVFGLSLWMIGLLITYSLWGLGALVFGLLLCGIGVVPIAFLALLFNGAWGGLLVLVLLGIATYGTRFMAFYVLAKYEEKSSAINFKLESSSAESG